LADPLVARMERSVMRERPRTRLSRTRITLRSIRATRGAGASVLRRRVVAPLLCARRSRF